MVAARRPRRGPGSSTGAPWSGSRRPACATRQGASPRRRSRRPAPRTRRPCDTSCPPSREALETPLPGIVERVAVVDRAGWVRANLATFSGLFGRLEGELLDQIVPPGAGLAKASLALANRWITTRQFGLLLGFMGQRVLGQYDLALLSAEAEPGQLLFVEENVRQTARTLGVPLDPFRTWIALHETTHAFEFEAHPWLRPYLADRLERQLGGLSRSASDLGRDASRALGRALRGGDGHWLERLMSDEQRRLFRETQAVMSLLEGFSDHVMDEVGHDLVPGVETISARFHARRAARTPMERAILRITGLDLKLEQYARGERFVAAVQRAAGPAGLRRLWEGPETLPRDGERDGTRRRAQIILSPSARQARGHRHVAGQAAGADQPCCRCARRGDRAVGRRQAGRDQPGAGPRGGAARDRRGEREGDPEVAEAIEAPGGIQAVNLKVAEQYVGAFANIAKTNNTVIVPANLADLAGLITAAMTVFKAQAK